MCYLGCSVRKSGKKSGFLELCKFRYPVIARNEAIQLFLGFLVCFVVPPRNDELQLFPYLKPDFYLIFLQNNLSNHEIPPPTQPDYLIKIKISSMAIISC